MKRLTVLNPDAPPRRVYTGEPRSLVDSWPFIAFLGVVSVVLLLARAWGWLA